MKLREAQLILRKADATELNQSQDCSLGEQKQQKFLLSLAGRDMARDGEGSQKSLPVFRTRSLSEGGLAERAGAE
ncbi:hypothetical protein A2U01_0052130, partial [Trifolium medium]|nr:hypothetical protein [Trifolium medium]